MRSGPGVARTILLLHIISARPSKQPRMVRTFLKVYMELGSYFLFLQEQIKDIIIWRGVGGRNTSIVFLQTTRLVEREERECCLLVLNSVTSTQLLDTSARGRVVVCLVCVCLVFVCKYVLGLSRVSQPLNLRLCLPWHPGFLTSPHASPTCRRRRPNSYRLLRRSTPGPPPIPWAHLFHLPASPRPPLYTPTMTT